MSEELIAAIDRAIRITRHTDARTALWTRDDCAEYLKISRSALDRMIVKGGFCPARLSVTTCSKGQRWIPQDVIDWAMSRQFQAGRPRAA